MINLKFRSLLIYTYIFYFINEKELSFTEHLLGAKSYSKDLPRIILSKSYNNPVSSMLLFTIGEKPIGLLKDTARNKESQNLSPRKSAFPCTLLLFWISWGRV